MSDYFPEGLLLRSSRGGFTRLRGWLRSGRPGLAARAARHLASLGARSIRRHRPVPPSHPRIALHGRFPPRRIGPFLILAASGARPARPLPPARPARRGPSLRPWPARPIPILLTQGQAFGSGRHESTRLLLERLAARPPKGGVLDVGAGSGILGFACLALGAPRVVAVEQEAAACAELRLNRGLNRVAPRDLPVLSGRFPLARLRGRRYSLVLANLVTPLLLDLMDPLASVVEPGGVLLCGGIHTAPEAGAVSRAARARGLRPQGSAELRAWRVLEFLRPARRSRG